MDFQIRQQLKTLNTFLETTDYEFRCDKICGKSFKNIEEHSEFIENGGCNKLIDIMSAS